MARIRTDRRSSWHQRRKKSNRQPRPNISPSFLHRIDTIPSLALEELPLIITGAALEENVPIQTTVIEKCLQRILNIMDPQCIRSPRPEQVRTLRRIIFGKGDTLLIARTGFGKSLIFHAYSLLTGKITIQIIPLSKLGDEQLLDIQRLGNTRPCLITSESKKKERDMIRRFQAREYTHVLLGPEQASSKAFRTALKDPQLQQQIGLVAIDECHLVKQWKDFRADFTMLYELRSILRQDVIWFGCSATLNNEAEQLVLQNTGFRTIGPNSYQTEVIRTSINRADISICVCPIPRRKLGLFDSLYFLLDNAVDTNIQDITPEQIPKTIVFIDGRTKVSNAAAYLRQMLQSQSESFPLDQQYTTTSQGGRACVFDVVNTYTSHVAQYDRDLRYTEFKKASSITRIIVATTALGMGVNIPDIARVVVWKFPIDNDPSEVWQRIGRGGRGEGQRSKAYIFLPYWAFDTEGCNRPRPIQLAVSEQSATQRKRTHRNMLPSHRALAHSRLNNSFTPGDVSDTESIASSASATSQNEPISHDRGLRYWTKTDLERRAGLLDSWKSICNSQCKRSPFLDYLGEQKLPKSAQSIQVPPEQCCNGCNPTLFPVFTQAPEGQKPLGAPRPGTRAGIALNLLDQWAAMQAESAYSNPGRRFPMPPSVYMATNCRWQLAWLYQTEIAAFWESVTIEQLAIKAPLLQEWRYYDCSIHELLTQLQRLSNEIDETYILLAQEKKESRKQKQQSQANTRLSNSELSEPAIASTTSRDDMLAIQVARQEALRDIERRGIMNSISRDTSLDIAGTVPLVADQGIQRALMLLRQARSQAQDADNSIRSAESRAQSLGLNDIVPDSQIEVTVPETQLSADLIATPRKAIRQKSAKTNKNSLPLKRRAPLSDQDGNIRKTVSFSPVSRSGRNRKLTNKGGENFYILEK
jgi:superfamily II DNA helicase RecQ